MNKVFGILSDFSYIRIDGKRVVIGYDLVRLEERKYYEWKEVYLHNGGNMPSLQEVKDAIVSDINAHTQERILNGFVWNEKNVYLSEENQRNFAEAQRVAQISEGSNLPVTFKIGETSDGEPVYHTFETVKELTNFYVASVNYIQSCLSEGWSKKDRFDFTEYERLSSNGQQN